MLKDATYLANLIKNKKLSPNEALDEMEKRARQNKGLNAFVELDINKEKTHVKKIESKKINL